MNAKAPNAFAIALAQLNPVMGDIPGNLARARAAREKARAAGADLILFSELFITGYPPEDLVLKPAFQTDAMEAVENLAKDTADSGPAVLIGTPWVKDGALYNAVAYLDAGKVAGTSFKVDLPNYGVFDEKRVFAPGPMPGPFNIRGVRIGVPICEDIWGGDPVECLCETGTEILLVPNGSPFDALKRDHRLNVTVAHVVECNLPLAYLNQVGGQDELVFDGGSFVLNADRSLAVQLPSWEEALSITHWRREGEGWVCEQGPLAEMQDQNMALYSAMVLGLKDYVNKNRFPGVVLGLSGGIDSAISAAVAVDALGASRVRAVMMPSRFTSKDSLEDAAAVAKLLGIAYDIVPIEEPMRAFGEALAPIFAGRVADATEENIQARIRGVILMAISNKFGPMVLTTGNKSEMSVGYATLYGDMAGGYNVLKDLYKTQVFALSRWRNQTWPNGALGPQGRMMPERVIDKPPTAELRADQKDEDSLPPYDVLDSILELLVEGEKSFEEVVAKGYDPAIVRRVEQLLYVAEYKRRQAAPGVKLTTRNFGRDRRYPITNAFRDAR
ncbi:MAG TPA: NAD+ synthase [Micropepsaceae bacterium]